ncbi:APC amino acid permease [Laccaria bicolor S238N-H82]|uniref:APC amino acid permease n=1 Tax=Laccaria bicolor (strain S238N-H82 / ATCC MYA-4686) TaxID=486041 RepID=B0DFD7_LACBS|nr:APC amino acid permease [Laccaria bicolor S238N-H82]EDR06686.1 APC amino acid permease [Laccaria bicolor S238N-H82]|eukprot:XP_001882533.1 APC amino acid permease [Laccaria bicolor S238N-H82]
MYLIVLPEHHGEEFDNVPTTKRQLGLFSAAFLIFNRVIGTGIYATPSNILRASGSVGVALIMWLVGAIIAACGTNVYIELGTGIPRSGGEKNYLEFIYRRPRFMAASIFTVYALIMGTASANSVVFSEYLLHSMSFPPSRLNTRLVAFLCLTFIFLIHGTLLKWGLRLQNTLAVFKLVVLTLIALAGIFCLFGVPGFAVRVGYQQPHNFEWNNFWEGSGTGANAFVSGLYNVIWSFIGYSNANYALSEVKNPVKTLKRAAPLAMFFVTSVYLLINVAYFAVVSKTDILESKHIVAALFFRNLFGPTTEKALSAFIALSTLGNLLSGQFSQGRVIQELGREGILPYSSIFASNKPFGAPFSGLLMQYLVSCTFLLAVPPGDVYLFLISLSSYSASLVNALVAFGLLLLYTNSYRSWDWNPPFRAPKLLVMVFFISNIFLIAVPFIPPTSGSKTYETLPYWSHSVGAFSVSLVGIGYWYIWSVWLPNRNGYTLERDWTLQDDGVPRWTFRKVPVLGR